jgi:hypothetical protein
MFIHLFPFEGNEAENLLRRLTNLFTVFSSLFSPLNFSFVLQVIIGVKKSSLKAFFASEIILLKLD